MVGYGGIKNCWVIRFNSSYKTILLSQGPAKGLVDRKKSIDNQLIIDQFIITWTKTRIVGLETMGSGDGQGAAEVFTIQNSYSRLEGRI